MGGFFGVASKDDCVFDMFFGVDYHSHLGTRRAGMAVYGENGIDRAIHNIENAPFRTKFDKEVNEMKGKVGIASLSDYEPQPLTIRSHHGRYAIVTVVSHEPLKRRGDPQRRRVKIKRPSRPPLKGGDMAGRGVTVTRYLPKNRY